jgi:hypothetical protein
VGTSRRREGGSVEEAGSGNEENEVIQESQGACLNSTSCYAGCLLVDFVEACLQQI